jgi:dipeptidase D
VNFAKERGLYCYRDSRDNVVVRKAATRGYESRPTVIIQGHTDIVCEKSQGSDIDMEKEGPRISRDGDFLRADGSTLGADDGVAMAYALAILDSSDIPHPEIEAVFTSDEETGLIGASALDCSILGGKVMINIDSDEEGVFTVGCAGGVRIDFSLPVTRSQLQGSCYRIAVSGLLGGHSGIEIGRNRANAIKLLGEALEALPICGILDVSGGNADNAIPRDAEARFIAKEITEKDLKALEAIIAPIREREPEAKIELDECSFTGAFADKESSEKILALIREIPTGVTAMSKDIEGLVETSLNMGIIRLSPDVLSLTVSVRSSENAEKDTLRDKVTYIGESIGASVTARGDYPGWGYRKDSPLRDTAVKVYREKYGKEPKVITIHAGLECGLFSDKIEGLDCISIGPDNRDIHTPAECLSLPSFMRVYEFLLDVLKKI